MIPFLDPSVIESFSNSLTPNGTLSMNVLYSEEPTMENHETFISKFKPYFRQCIIEHVDGNYVLGCSNQDIPRITPDYLKYRRNKIDKQVKELFGGNYTLIM